MTALHTNRHTSAMMHGVAAADEMDDAATAVSTDGDGGGDTDSIDEVGGCELDTPPIVHPIPAAAGSATVHPTESVLRRRTEDAPSGTDAPYTAPAPSARVAWERVHGRPETRRVMFTLPTNHIDRVPKGRGGSNRPSRKGLALTELHERYLMVCGAFKIAPSKPVVEAFAAQRMAGSELAPAVLTLEGVDRCHVEEVMALCEVIVLNANLRCLDVSDSGLRDDHFEKICNALIFRRSVDRLNLADNPRMGVDGCRFVALMLQRCHLLTYLNISGVPMSPKVAGHFGFVLLVFLLLLLRFVLPVPLRFRV
jgi:hypothetical protein